MKMILTRFLFNGKMRRKVYLRLATQLRYNVSLLFSLETLRDQSKKRNKVLSEMYSHIIEQLELGRKLASTLAEYIPNDELMLIQSGEAGGNLQEGFLLAAKVIQAKQNIGASIRMAIAYPMVLFTLLILLLVVVSFMVIPNFALISDPTLWTGSAYALYVISNIITSPFGVIMLVTLLLSILAVSYSFPNLTGKTRIILDRFPPYSMYRLTIGTTWLFTIASLIKSGKQLNDILKEMIQSETNSPYLKERLHAILESYAVGKKFGESLVLANMDFPDAELVDDIKVYSELPHFEETLYQIAEDWLNEGTEKIKDSSKIFNTICLLFIASAIIGIVLAFQNIQQTMIQGI